MAQGLCVYWRFNEIQAGRVLDASGLNNQGLLSPSADISGTPLQPKRPIADEDEWGEKLPLGHSLKGEVSCTGLQGLADAKSLTIEFHVRRVGVAQGVRSYPLLNFSHFLKLEISKIGTVSLNVGSTQYDTSKRIIINEWMHFALILDESTLTLYVDGVSCFSNVQGNMKGGPCSLTAGSDICEITELRLFSLARSPGLIKEFMNNPLPRPVTVSKWKGLRIKANVDSDKSWSLPAQTIGKLKSRRITDTDNAKDVPIDDSPRNAHVAQVQAVPDEPATAEGSVLDFPASEKVHPKPPTPESSQYTRKATPTQEPVVPEVPQAETVPTVGKPGDMGLYLQESLSNESAVERIDAFLEAVVAKKDLWIDAGRIWDAIKAMSQYMRTKNRIGPFLCPMPNQEFLIRLRMTCNYFALTRCIERPNGYFIGLRIPLLPHHVKQLTRQAINEAAATGDACTESALIKRFILNFRLEMSNDEIEALNRRLFQLGHVSVFTHIACPLCHLISRDPLQDVCAGGCQSVFTVCYVTGKLVPKSDCVACKVCNSVISTDPQMNRHNANILSNRTFSVPTACPLCSCIGSLDPLD